MGEITPALWSLQMSETFPTLRRCRRRQRWREKLLSGENWQQMFARFWSRPDTRFSWWIFRVKGGVLVGLKIPAIVLFWQGRGGNRVIVFWSRSVGQTTSRWQSVWPAFHHLCIFFQQSFNLLKLNLCHSGGWRYQPNTSRWGQKYNPGQCCATWWPNLLWMQVVPHGGKICNQCCDPP